MAATNLPLGRRKLCAYPFLEQMGLGAGCARGLTQQEVADFLELARTTVTALEKEEGRIRPDELISLAGLYGRQVSTFVGSRASLCGRSPGGSGSRATPCASTSAA